MKALSAAMAVLVSITASAEDPQPAPVIEKGKFIRGRFSEGGVDE